MTKSSAYPPLDGLVDLACRDGVDIRPTLLRVLTDLYVQKPTHSADEETQYVELALGLIEAVDTPTRAAVAGKPVRLSRRAGGNPAQVGRYRIPAWRRCLHPERGRDRTISSNCSLRPEPRSDA